MKQNNAYAKLKMGEQWSSKMKNNVAYTFQDKLSIKIILAQPPIYKEDHQFDGGLF